MRKRDGSGPAPVLSRSRFRKSCASDRGRVLHRRKLSRVVACPPARSASPIRAAAPRKHRAMDVQCERCKAEYEFDDALISGRGTAVKCTNCGHQFKIRRASSELPEAVPDRWSVRTTEGRELVFTSLRELQKAIMARQVGRADALIRAARVRCALGGDHELGRSSRRRAENASASGPGRSRRRRIRAPRPRPESGRRSARGAPGVPHRSGALAPRLRSAGGPRRGSAPSRTRRRPPRRTRSRRPRCARASTRSALPTPVPRRRRRARCPARWAFSRTTAAS